MNFRECDSADIPIFQLSIRITSPTCNGMSSKRVLLECCKVSGSCDSVELQYEDTWEAWGKRTLTQGNKSERQPLTDRTSTYVCGGKTVTHTRKWLPPSSTLHYCPDRHLFMPSVQTRRKQKVLKLRVRCELTVSPACCQNKQNFSLFELFHVQFSQIV